MPNYEIIPALQKKLNKLSKKDLALYEQVLKKIEEIITIPDIDHYKNLSYSQKDEKRVHIGHFVLVFTHILAENKIKFLDFDHHDNIYRNK